METGHQQDHRAHGREPPHPAVAQPGCALRPCSADARGLHLRGLDQVSPSTERPCRGGADATVDTLCHVHAARPHASAAANRVACWCAGSVGLELAAGRDGKAVAGMSDGVHHVTSWMPCPQLDGCIVINM